MTDQEPIYEIPDAAKAQSVLESKYEEAARVLKDEDQIERLLQSLEKLLKDIPLAGEAISSLPVLISLVRSYVKKEYTDIPVGSVVAVVAAILYTVSTIDFIPDFIPVAGYLDDAAVIAVCLNHVSSEVEEYRAWRVANGKQLV